MASVLMVNLFVQYVHNFIMKRFMKELRFIILEVLS